MKTCAEFLIVDPRLGDPKAAPSPRRISDAAGVILRPLRDAMIARGFAASEVTAGKPWGSGYFVDAGKTRVSLFFFPSPCVSKNRWEGCIYIIPAPSFWQRLLLQRDRASEERLTERVAAEMKQVLEQFQSFQGVRWVSLQHLCSTKAYES